MVPKGVRFLPYCVLLRMTKSKHNFFILKIIYSSVHFKYDYFHLEWDLTQIYNKYLNIHTCTTYNLQCNLYRLEFTRHLTEEPPLVVGSLNIFGTACGKCPEVLSEHNLLERLNSVYEDNHKIQ